MNWVRLMELWNVGKRYHNKTIFSNKRIRRWFRSTYKPDNCWLGFYFVLVMASYVLHPPGFFGTFGVSERIVTEDFCKIFLFFAWSTKRAKRSCPDGERAQRPSQSCEAACKWGGTCCLVGDGGWLFWAEKWRYMLLSKNVHDTDDNF